LFMTQSSQSLEPPQNPGRFKMHFSQALTIALRTRMR
jgi:hypothetical protein